MALVINGYRISNTNGNANQPDIVRVYNDTTGEKVFEYKGVRSRNPLRYLKKYDGMHRKAFVAGAEKAGIDADTIRMIVS